MADSQFKTSVNALYSIDGSGQVTVFYNVTLQNLTTEVYATSYSLVLQNISPTNVKAQEGQQNIPVTITNNQGQTLVNLNFPDNVVGKGQSRNFEISFNQSDIATKTGEVWEVYIPKLSSQASFDDYNLTLSVPKSFGSLAYISPEASSIEEDDLNTVYSFTKDQIGVNGITAGFGAFQVFEFNLSYHLENPLEKSSYQEIAIPPDTSLQKVYYQSLDPKPNDVRVDNDGNWLAKYILAPRQEIVVKALGSVQIFSGPRPFLRPNQELLNQYLTQQPYWEVNDPQIVSVAQNLKTPEAIYNYVTKTLKYNFQRVAPNVQRLGARGVLTEPSNAICLEFTDLFVTLARAAGIPAREIEGYAYTNDPQTEPLSLVADVLHAWPEYWDNRKNTWIPVDPTWGSTSGIDFFNKFDLRHFAFVTHGLSSTEPFSPGSYKLGVNPEKDVFVNFGSLPEQKQPTLNIKVNNNNNIPFFPQTFTVTLTNTGATAFYNLKSDVLFDGQTNSTKSLTVLPPYGSYQFDITIPFSVFANKTPSTVTVLAEDNKVTFNTSKSSEIQLTLLVFSFLIVCLIIVVLYHLKGKAIWQFIRTVKQFFVNLYGRLFKKPEQITGK